MSIRSAWQVLIAGSLVATGCGGGSREEASSVFGEGPGEAEEPAGSTGHGDGHGDDDGTGDGDGDGDGDPAEGGGTKFGLATFPDSGDGLACGCGNTEWSYVWISNSAEHTVSKINTRTMIEEGRYHTRADNSGNPSRT